MIEANAAERTDAVANTQPALSLQPIFAMDSGSLFGVEAHLYQDEAQETGPNAFKQTTEGQAGLTGFSLGQIESALSLLSQWDSAKTPKLFVAIDTKMFVAGEDVTPRLEEMLWRAEIPNWLLTLVLHEPFGSPTLQKSATTSGS